MVSCSVCTNIFLKNHTIWQDLVEKTLIHGVRRYKAKFFRCYKSFCGFHICKVCILAYRILLRSTFEYWNYFTDIIFSKCDNKVIMQIVKLAPELHRISHPYMGNLYSNAVMKKNEMLLNFILSLKQYSICDDLYHAVSIKYSSSDFFLNIALMHPRFNKIKEDKQLQETMIYLALMSRDAKKFKHVLHFYGNRTYTIRQNQLWINAFFYTCFGYVMKLWKIMFDYGINPCVRNDQRCYIMDIVVRYENCNKLRFLLSYNIPIHASVIYTELYKLYLYHSTLPSHNSFYITLCMSYLLLYSKFWPSIIKYFHNNSIVNSRMQLKSLEPIVDCFQYHKNVPLSLQTLTVIAIRKNLKIGPVEKILKSLKYPTKLKHKISLSEEFEIVRRVGLSMHDRTL